MTRGPIIREFHCVAFLCVTGLAHSPLASVLVGAAGERRSPGGSKLDPGQSRETRLLEGHLVTGLILRYQASAKIKKCSVRNTNIHVPSRQDHGSKHFPQRL